MIMGYFAAGAGRAGADLEPFTLGRGRSEFRFEVSERDVVEQHLGRVAQAVVDKADVGAPALVLHDGPQFFLAFLSLPEFLKVAIVIAQVGELAAQFAGAHVAVEVDDDGSVAGGAGHGPGMGFGDVFKLDLVVQRQRAVVVNLGDLARHARAAPQNLLRVVVVDRLNILVEGGKAMGGDLLQGGVLGLRRE